MFVEKKLGKNRSWINIDSDLITETSELYQRYDIDQETIEYALDKNERAHMDYNRENGTVTFIYNVLDLEKEKYYYETIPMTFIVQDNRLVTISNADNAYIINQMQRYVDSHEELSIYKLFFAGLEMISNAYYPVIERLDKQKDEVNRLLLEHISGHAIYRRLNEVEREQFEDAMIEARQLVSMTELISQVLHHLTSSYNNILNNNLNNNLSNLTIMENLLGVLAVITGFFGMNVPLPFMEEKYAWVVICIVSFFLWLLLSRLLRWIVNKR